MMGSTEAQCALTENPVTSVRVHHHRYLYSRTGKRANGRAPKYRSASRAVLEYRTCTCTWSIPGHAPVLVSTLDPLSRFQLLTKVPRIRSTLEKSAIEMSGIENDVTKKWWLFVLQFENRNEERHVVGHMRTCTSTPSDNRNGLID